MNLCWWWCRPIEKRKKFYSLYLATSFEHSFIIQPPCYQRHHRSRELFQVEESIPPIKYSSRFIYYAMNNILGVNISFSLSHQKGNKLYHHTQEVREEEYEWTAKNCPITERLILISKWLLNWAIIMGDFFFYCGSVKFLRISIKNIFLENILMSGQRTPALLLLRIYIINISWLGQKPITN